MKKINDSDLKPCPFCGNKKPKFYVTGGYWKIKCFECDVSIIGTWTKERAMELWNSRPIEPSPADQLAGLKSECDTLKVDLQRMTTWAQVLADGGTAYKKERDEAQAENARLRAALEVLASIPTHYTSQYELNMKQFAIRALENKNV